MGGKKKSSPVTVGYRYYWDIHSGLGRGPVDEVVELRVDDKTAYMTTPNEITQSRAIYIDKPNLFGGEGTGGEGGVQGRMEILMGESDQKRSQMLVNLLKGIYNPSLQAMHFRFRKGRQKQQADEADAFFKNPDIPTVDLPNSELIPAFRGIVSTVYSGLISCYSAYPKKHSYRVRRTHKGWQGGVWYPEKCRIVLQNKALNITGLTPEQEEQARQIHAMNPAHILVQCATDSSWGGKKAWADLELDSYQRAADTLYNEGFGLCIRYNRQSSIKEFIQLVLDHIGAVQYDDLQTGKLAIKLLRNDYSPDSLHTFTADNGILEVQDDDIGASDANPNQVIVTYLDPVANKEGQAKADNLAAIRMHGVISKKVDYKGVPTFDLAARLAQRELEMSASGLMRLKVIFDMRGSQIKPGDVYKLRLPEREIEGVIFRVGGIRNGNQEGTFEVTMIQDIFGLSSANYSTKPSESLHIAPDYSAKPIDIAKSRLFELPYHLYPILLSEADLAYLKPTDCRIGSLAVSPSQLTLHYDLLVSAGGNYVDNADAPFTSSVILQEDLGKYDTQLKFAVDGDYSGLADAHALLLGDEIVKIESVNFTNHTITIGRGCADTLPQVHHEGERAWCYLLGFGADETPYLPNETLKAKLISHTAQNVLEEAKAPELNLTTIQRWSRPYPPANFRVDGVLTDRILDASAFTLSWAYRDRVIQADSLIPHHQASTVLGENVEYEIQLLDGQQVVRTITTKAESFKYPDEAKVDGEQFNAVTLYAKEGKLKSWQGYHLTVSGAMVALNGWDYRQAFDMGDSYLNRYDDRDMPDGKYIMLRSAMTPSTEMYRRWMLTPGQYQRFNLGYKIGTYSQRNGLCEITVQHLVGNVVVKEFKSGPFGNYPKSEWHNQMVDGAIANNVTEIRFKISIPSSVTNNAIAFKEIILRVGKEEN
ncbi:phage tail protein [Pasteurella multocida]|uniref:phage tail protein n=1 Tax=Pasteurella multocida TaxID=747 RepID=UPI002C1737B6|nr:phage tail protein [Pasteurella multocida]MEB3470167.1 phage tail protein [Pasteurella multocida]